MFVAYCRRHDHDLTRQQYAFNCVEEFLVYNKQEDQQLMLQCHNFFDNFFLDGSPVPDLDDFKLQMKTGTIFKRTEEKDPKGRTIYRLVHGKAQFVLHNVFDGMRIVHSRMNDSVEGWKFCCPDTSATYVIGFKNLALRQSLNIFRQYIDFQFCKRAFEFYDVEFHFYEGVPGCGKTKLVVELAMQWTQTACDNEYNFGN